MEGFGKRGEKSGRGQLLPRRAALMRLFAAVLMPAGTAGPAAGTLHIEQTGP
jgi:hypothetical protein